MKYKDRIKDIHYYRGDYSTYFRNTIIASYLEINDAATVVQVRIALRDNHGKEILTFDGVDGHYHSHIIKGRETKTEITDPRLQVFLRNLFTRAETLTESTGNDPYIRLQRCSH